MPYKDKEKQRKSQLKSYHKLKHKKKQKVTDYKKLVRGRLRQYVWNYKKANPCVDCGEDDPRVLDFDHVRGKKKFGISQAGALIGSIKALEEEIAKCDIRCANCHRIQTFERDPRYKNGLKM